MLHGKMSSSELGFRVGITLMAYDGCDVKKMELKNHTRLVACSSQGSADKDLRQAPPPALHLAGATAPRCLLCYSPSLPGLWGITALTFPSCHPILQPLQFTGMPRFSFTSISTLIWNYWRNHNEGAVILSTLNCALRANFHWVLSSTSSSARMKEQRH